MEALYSKLYDKYTRLKANKESEIEQYNFDQEQKFKVYVSAADELIKYLENEKDTLSAQVSDLTNELVSIRSAKDEDQEKYELMLLKENQKNKELSEEIERLNRKEFNSGSTFSSAKSKKSTSRKRLRVSTSEKEVDQVLGGSDATPGGSDRHEHSVLYEPQSDLDKENTFSGAISNFHEPKCCRRRLDHSVNASDANVCMFQELVECLLDLKFSVATQSDDILMTAIHDSSGYTFNLGWVKNALGEEELMYRVSSLGTFERVAPEWMRDVMLFSKSMCRIFFEKIIGIVKLHE